LKSLRWTKVGLRFIFENYEFPFTSIVDKDIRAGNLRSKYDVIVIPGELSETSIIQGHRPGSMPPEYAGGIGDASVENLREFVNQGGTLVTMDEANVFAKKQFALPVKNTLEGARPQERSERPTPAWAAANQRILVTHDVNTIPKYAYERVQAAKPMAGVIIVPDDLAIGAAIEDLVTLVECSRSEEFVNQVRYLQL
jgi:hypothetical protein